MRTVSELWHPGSHEPLAGEQWDERRARGAIETIVRDAEQAFDAERLWPLDPRDVEEDAPPPTLRSLYLGAAGMFWALDALAAVAAPERDLSAATAFLHEQYLAAPDFAPEIADGPVPSLWMGEAGILLVADLLAPEPGRRDRLHECVRRNVANPTRERMWGAPGTMLAAQVMLEQTGEDRWRDVWRESAAQLLDDSNEELWLQELYGRKMHFVGPAHGFVGNIFVLWRGRDLLGAERWADVERRAVTTVKRLAHREHGFAQWIPALEDPPEGATPTTRTQWCHGAPGVVASVAELARDDYELTELLCAGGELTWHAGPLVKGAGLCHGTGGNGYAFLKLFRRTADERWLERARAFATHAIEQVEEARPEHGRGRCTLWTGDVGAALYLKSCLDAGTAFPTLDVW